LISESYAALYDIAQVGLRFFTVYGPWGRPDMAYFKFADAMMDGREIPIFNHGDLMRDFTWITNIVDGVVSVALGGPDGGNANGRMHRIYNIGNNKPERLMDFINVLEDSLGITANKSMLGMQPGDVYTTAADISAITADYGFKPTTTIQDGLPVFADWFKSWRTGAAIRWSST
jgi:UDP-glucuronate 4-epimerase